MRPWIAVPLLALAGCLTVPVGGAHRSPRFTAARAPAPAVALELTACHLSGAPARTPPAPGVPELLTQRLGTAPVPVPEPWRARICAALTPDQALFADLTTGGDWTVGSDLAPLVSRAAEAHGAGSVLIPVTRDHGGCGENDAFFREGGPLGAAPTEPAPTCGDDSRVDVGLFLFSADGTLLWKASDTAAENAPVSLQPAVERITADVPVDVARP